MKLEQIIDKVLPAVAVGLGTGALFYYLYKEKRVFSFHGFEGLGSEDDCDCGCGSSASSKHKKDKEKEEKDKEYNKKLIKIDKLNKDMKLGPGGYRRTHHKRGTIKVGNKRREVEIDDGFDPSELDYELAFGDPKIQEFSFGGISI